MNPFAGGNAAGTGATIRIPSFDNVEVKINYIAPGSYRAKLRSIKQDVSKAGNDMIVFSFDVTGPSGVLKDRRLQCPLTANALWKLARTCGALGIPEGDISTEKYAGKAECMVNIIDDGHAVDDPGTKYCKIQSCDPLPADAPTPSAMPADDVPF
jgi:hypothetical protein